MAHKLNLNSGHVFLFKAHEIGLVDSLNSTISNKIQQCRWVASDHQLRGWKIHQLPGLVMTNSLRTWKWP